jgi:hypothetical protein
MVFPQYGILTQNLRTLAMTIPDGLNHLVRVVQQHFLTSLVKSPNKK